VHLANLAPSPVPFDVFAADPVDTAPEHAVAQSPSAPPRPKPVTTPPRGRFSQTGRTRLSSATVPAPVPSVPASDSGVALAPPSMALVTGALVAASAQTDVPIAVAAAAEPASLPSQLEAVTAVGEVSAAPLRPALTEVPPPPPVPAADPPPPPMVSVVAPEPMSLGQIGVPEPSLPPPTMRAREQAPPPSQARTTWVAARRADSPTAGPSSSPLGLALDRLRIRLDGAAIRTTDRETDVISGKLVGGQPERVVVHVGERMSVPTLAGRAFATAVKLSPGINRVRVLATDAQGAEAEQIVTVEYRPPATPDLAITSPRDGHRLGPDDAPLLAVEGEVTDSSLSMVWIVANDRRVMAPITAGRFRHVLPILEPTVRVRVETGSDDRRSQTVMVDAAAAMPAIGLFLGDWPHQTAGPAQMTVMWRPNPAKLDSRAQPLAMPELTADILDSGTGLFYLRNTRPGVYTLMLTYRAGAPPTVRPVLYIGGAARALQPLTLDGSGPAVVARLLLPQGVLWEDDDWFSGRSASGDTITKFRFPEGVSWTERLGNLGR
jgi:hypothetical protein